MNSPVDCLDQEALRAFAERLGRSADSLDELRQLIEATVRRGNAILVAAKLARIMHQVRTQRESVWRRRA